LQLADYSDPSCGSAALFQGVDSDGDSFGRRPASGGSACRQWTGVVFVPTSGMYRLWVEDPERHVEKIWLDDQEVGEGPTPLARGYVGLRIQRAAGAPAWTLRWIREGGGDATTPATFAAPALAHGLYGYYFANPQFRGPAAIVQRDWAFFPNAITGGPYSISWRGALDAAATGSYLFQAGGDEGEQVIVDGSLVVDADIRRPNGATQSNTISLKKGRHDIELRYFKAEGAGQSLAFSWKPPGQDGIVPLPAAVLVPTGDPLREQPRNQIPYPQT
jgi:hypothetical protein